MHTLLVVVLALLPNRELDGEAAVARARTILASIGYRQQLTLQSVSMVSDSTARRVWGMTLSGEHGKFMLTLDPATGKLLWLQTPFMPEAPTYAANPPSPATRGLATSYLRVLGYDSNVQLDDDSGNRAIPYHAVFLLKLNGLRFFNLNPTYAHRLALYPASASVVYFRASPALPEIAAWKPAVSADTAMRLISAWAADRAKQHRRQFDAGDVAPQLGYWKFRSEHSARLVWRAMHYTKIGGRSLQQGPIRVFVDAITGEVIEPDDPARGDYP
jgi:hypothetical protein